MRVCARWDAVCVCEQSVALYVRVCARCYAKSVCVSCNPPPLTCGVNAPPPRLHAQPGGQAEIQESVGHVYFDRTEHGRVLHSYTQTGLNTGGQGRRKEAEHL